jgi:glycosyltransferase involved in cell wall biosynthesis
MKRLVDRFTGDAILHGAARIIAVSSEEESQLLSLGVTAETIRRVQNPVDPAQILPLPCGDAFRKRHGVPDGARIVLFLGRVTPNKRVDVLLRSLVGIPKAVLVVAGPDGGAVVGLRRAAASRSMTTRVILTGPLDDTGRREALANADLLALPSAHEIFGLAPMEALLAGILPVVSEGTGCAELIRAWDAGLVVDGGDAEALGAAIRSALDDPEGCRKRAARGAEAVRAELSPEKIASRTSEIYAELAEPTGRGRE